ncbi:MAG: DUF4956 domain-containing protein [Lachnospiraceae bacterium]|nr:DUF4956 domain-containing protein [Lachnospiraceae bacterium]
MPEYVIQSIINGGNITVENMLLATVCSLLCGFIIAGIYMIKRKHTQSFIVSLVILPSIVQIVIMLVNGNIGAGVAVAGAFSLVRYRSIAGKGQEIAGIFLAMAVGLANGMGYIWLALVFALVISIVQLVIYLTNFGGEQKESRNLRILIPENLDYEGKFEDIFHQYLQSFELMHVKTCNMGTMYKLEYDVVLDASKSTKEFMDKIRERNGNLEVALSRMRDVGDEL